MIRVPMITYVLAMSAVVATSSRADHLRNLQPGQPVPSFSLSGIDGTTIDSGSYAGEVLIVVFVAATQKQSEQAAAAAHDVAKSIANAKLNVLFVTADVGHEAYFREFRTNARISLPFGFDFDRRLYGQLGLIVLPTTIIADRQGKLSHVMAGYKSDYRHKLEAYAEQNLGLIDEAELRERLTSRTFQRNRPSDRAARHRAAARLLWSKGLLDDAEMELASAIEIDAANDDARLDLASLRLARDDVAGAAELVERVRANDPTHRRATLWLGIVRFHQDALDEAESILQQALLLNPDPARTEYYLGQVYEKKGEKDQALAFYRKALSRLLAGPSD